MLSIIEKVISLEMLVILLIGAALFFYIKFLRMITKRRREKVVVETKIEKMNDTERERYARHIVLREIGGQGQNKLRNSSVLVVGVGGLGNPILAYLSAAGIGHLGFIDFDEVSLSNLQRQTLFDEDDLNMHKVIAAERKLKALNPFIKLSAFNQQLDFKLAIKLFSDFDLIIDGTDNFETRKLVNFACNQLGKPLLSAAITQWEGQVSYFPQNPDSACFECVFDQEPAEGLAPNCSEGGVLGALPGIIGSITAAEAIKLIVGVGVDLENKILIYNALDHQMRILKVKKRNNCSVCR